MAECDINELDELKGYLAWRAVRLKNTVTVFGDEVIYKNDVLGVLGLYQEGKWRTFLNELKVQLSVKDLKELEMKIEECR